MTLTEPFAAEADVLACPSVVGARRRADGGRVPGKPPAGARESPEEVAAILGVVVLGVVVLIVAVLVLDGTETWLLASSAVLFLVCGAGLLANARSRAPTRARRVGRLEFLVDPRQARPPAPRIAVREAQFTGYCARAYPECRCRNASVRSLKAWTFS